MKKFFLIMAMAVTLLLGVGNPGGSVYASSTSAAKNQVCAGVKGQAGSSCGTGNVDINKVLKGILNLLSVIAGIAAVIMIVISGMKYITSGGEAQAVTSAKRSLIYAIVGLIVVALAQVIVHFVLANTAG
jgi:hypothetical protein